MDPGGRVGITAEADDQSDQDGEDDHDEEDFHEGQASAGGTP
jgi:hypothetical protein